jgi:hypothetical protein
MALLAGGCLCGKQRYTVSGEPEMVGLCHCSDCQKETASAFSIIVSFPKDSFRLEGELRTHTTIGESGGKVNRSFCADCGSTIISVCDILPGRVLVKAGTFDDTSWITPSFNLYCDSAQS